MKNKTFIWNYTSDVCTWCKGKLVLIVNGEEIPCSCTY